MRPTLRARLTLVYASLFLAAGVVLLGATYVLLDHQLPQAQLITLSSQLPGPGDPGPQGGVVTNSGQLPGIRVGGETVAPEDLPNYIFERENGLRQEALSSLLTQGA